jgi:hypothetical protein
LEEIDDGVLLKEKLNEVCPHFYGMRALYGDRPNVCRLFWEILESRSDG